MYIYIYPSITCFLQRTVCGKSSPPVTYRNYHQPRRCGCWWCGCMRGCVYDGITRWGWGSCWSVEGCCCPLAPPVQGFPSLTNTGTATRRGDGRVVTPAPPWGPWVSWSPFSCCALFVLYRWFWNQIFTCGYQRERLWRRPAGLSGGAGSMIWSRCGKHSNQYKEWRRNKYTFFKCSVDRASWYIHITWTNKMHYLLAICFNIKPPHVSSRLVAHHQENELCIYSRWYSQHNAWHLPVVVYSQLILLMMSFKPVRNMYRLITDINWQ